jgi:cytochrome c oxidase subunit 2
MSSAQVQQSVLSPAGGQAASIHQLWSLMLWTTTVVFIVVIAFLVVGILRKGEGSQSSAAQRSLSIAVSVGVAATALILIVFLAASIWTGRKLEAFQSNAVTVNVVGHQWWWEFEYEEDVPSRRVHTANELHIPVNRPIVLKVTSRDVIHSIWVPNLQGKRDLIPGYTTAISLEADHPGIFRGQCAEFCGMQHAHMAFDIVAEPQADFDRWLNAMRQPAPPPTTSEATHGRDVFRYARCAGCHAVQGTDAAGLLGPDLTHLATRSTLGAGTLPNTPDELARWIRDPQVIKPGNQMPANPLPDDDLKALVAYLETLR